MHGSLNIWPWYLWLNSIPQWKVRCWWTGASCKYHMTSGTAHWEWGNLIRRFPFFGDTKTAISMAQHTYNMWGRQRMTQFWDWVWPRFSPTKPPSMESKVTVHKTDGNTSHTRLFVSMREGAGTLKWFVTQLGAGCQRSSIIWISKACGCFTTWFEWLIEAWNRLEKSIHSVCKRRMTWLHTALKDLLGQPWNNKSCSEGYNNNWTRNLTPPHSPLMPEILDSSMRCHR